MKPLFLLIALILLACCTKEEDPNGMQMIFFETQCANPWGTSQNGEEYLSHVKQYLEQKGVQVNAISREDYDSNGIHCNACFCPSGWMIVIRLPEDDMEKAEQIGFVKSD